MRRGHGFFSQGKKTASRETTRQLKRELQWLQTQVGRYKGKILAVGLLSLTGTIMGLVSAWPPNISYRRGHGLRRDDMWRAVAIMAAMLRGKLPRVSCRAFPPGWAPAETATPIASCGTRGVFCSRSSGQQQFPGTTGKFPAGQSRTPISDGELETGVGDRRAWDFVSQFPDGVNHRLGTGGRGISEGQAQRLAIARALLRKAPILLLDEATSDLDMATERRLLDNLHQSGLLRTCILVTHRPDQVLALVTAVRRREKLLQPGSFWWNFFEKVWIRVIPLRPGIVAAYSALTGAFCKAETAHD